MNNLILLANEGYSEILDNPTADVKQESSGTLNYVLFVLIHHCVYIEYAQNFWQNCNMKRCLTFRKLSS